jgi:hypothetical protein
MQTLEVFSGGLNLALPSHPASYDDNKQAKPLEFV